ncbi:MAG: EpsD family peptidyl-prolyl cis-trans isomerase [Burkholderiaceae bacterium]
MLAALMLIAAISGCSQDDKPPAGQVVAKVNDTEITVHQLNQLLQRMPGVTEANQASARREALRRLVDSELLQQQAVAAKLDRKPEVLQALQASRTDVLAGAYLQTVLARIEAPSDEECARFYRERPELFAQRKVARLSEIVLNGRSLPIEELNRFLAGARSVDDVRNWLSQRNATPVATAASTRSSDQLPIDAARLMATIKAGQFFAYPNGANVTIAQVESVTAAPLSEAAARPAIRNFLLQQRRNEAGKQEVERLRAMARIDETLAGDAPAAPAASVPVPTSTPAPAGAESAPPPAAAGGERPPGASDASIERGIKGLR